VPVRASPGAGVRPAQVLDEHVRCRLGSRVSQPVQVNPCAWSRARGECLLPGEDPKGAVDRGEVGREVGARDCPPIGPVDQFADQFSPGKRLLLSRRPGPVRRPWPSAR